MPTTKRTPIEEFRWLDELRRGKRGQRWRDIACARLMDFALDDEKRKALIDALDQKAAQLQIARAALERIEDDDGEGWFSSPQHSAREALKEMSQ